MAHYAFLDENGVVTEVIVGRDENDLVEGVSDWETFYGEVRGQLCKRTSYNTLAGFRPDGSPGFRMNFAGIGFTYRADLDAFVPPQPYPSWTLNEATCAWVPPVPMPTDGAYLWFEAIANWVAVPQSDT